MTSRRWVDPARAPPRPGLPWLPVRLHPDAAASRVNPAARAPSDVAPLVPSFSCPCLRCAPVPDGDDWLRFLRAHLSWVLLEALST